MQSNMQPAAPAAGALRRFSASRISRYVTCPLQAAFRYRDGLPDPMGSAAAFGKCMHHALEIYNKTSDYHQALAEFIHVWEHPELVEAVIEVWNYGATFDGYLQRGIEMLQNYHGQTEAGERQVVATEHKFLVPFGDFELFGYVDLVELRKNGSRNELHIVDYKTAKKVPKIKSLPWDIQFTVYSFAASQPEFWSGTDETPAIRDYSWSEMQKLEIRPMLYHLETSRTIDCGKRGDADYMRLFRVCTEIDKAITHDVYVPNLSGESCSLCPYHEPCGLPIPDESDQW